MKTIQIAYNKDFEKQCKLASEVGFRNISVNLNDIYEVSDRAYDMAPEHIAGILEKYNLKAVQSHLYYYHLLISAEILEEELEHRLMREIEVSGKLGIPYSVYHARAYQTGGYSKEKSLEINKKVVSKYLEQAEKYNTAIALENLFSWEGVTMYCPLYEDLKELCDSFNSDRVGVCWDFGHANLMEFEQSDAIKCLGDRIKCTHIHNNFKNSNDLHLPPDNGNIDWESTMKALKEIGYKGPLTLEIHCLYDDDILLRDFLRYNLNGLEFLQRIMDRY